MQAGEYAETRHRTSAHILWGMQSGGILSGGRSKFRSPRQLLTVIFHRKCSAATCFCRCFKCLRIRCVDFIYPHTPLFVAALSSISSPGTPPMLLRTAFDNSVLGHRIPEVPVPLFSVYPATKHAITALCQTVRQEIHFLKLNIKLTVS